MTLAKGQRQTAIRAWNYQTTHQMQQEIDLKGNSGWHGVGVQRWNCMRPLRMLEAKFCTLAPRWNLDSSTCGSTVMVIVSGGLLLQIKMKAWAQCYSCRTGDRYTASMDFWKKKSCWFPHLFARKLCRTWRVRKWSLPRRPAEVALSESCSSKEFESLTSPQIDSHPR